MRTLENAMRMQIVFVLTFLTSLPVYGADRYDPTAGLDPNRPTPGTEAQLQQVVLAVARDPWSSETRERWSTYLDAGEFSRAQIEQLIAQVIQEAEAYRGLHPETRGSSLDADEWRNRARGSLGRIAAGLG
jgi:hypothetical protein